MTSDQESALAKGAEAYDLVKALEKRVSALEPKSDEAKPSAPAGEPAPAVEPTPTPVVETKVQTPAEEPSAEQK